ncbi:SMI1/KNR4 family protein [Streptomyces sp. NPDC047017]|uniref:SMI1/KNR4 family protein n=1 Tax=Streptomyces sp. NPDC047017 TaxID=3155024 RepID=UPI003402F61B
MVDQSPPLPSVHDFATWEPLLRLLREGRVREEDGATPLRVGGRIGRHGRSLPRLRLPSSAGAAVRAEDTQRESDAVRRVRDGLVEAGVDDVAFNARITAAGRTTLRLRGPSPAVVDSGSGTSHPGTLLLVEGALPEPLRRLPEPTPAAAPAPSADPELLERTLRERLPHAIGATEAEIAAAEARLGVALPEELKALHRVTRSSRLDRTGDHRAAERLHTAVGCELLDLDGLYIADAASRECPWESAAMTAVVTPPDAAVQGLVGSPGWIAFGDNGGGDRLAIDLTPGPRGHLGQVVVLSHEEIIGADPVADSLTDLVLGRRGERNGAPRGHRPPAVAYVNVHGIPSVEAAAHPGLEVLSIGVWDAEPLGLAPVTGLPRLRSLSAYPGTLADPLEIAGLTGLEYLELGPQDWRALLDAGAVPRGLSAAAISARGDQDPLPVVALANELLTLWDRPQIVQTVLEGDLGPLP